MTPDPLRFLTKAQEGLATANLALSAGHFSACARDAYFAAYQAAVAALIHAGIADRSNRWSHEFVQSAFADHLINRRKVYPATLRSVLPDNLQLRITADYTDRPVSRANAAQALRRSDEFLAAIQRHITEA